MKAKKLIRRLKAAGSDYFIYLLCFFEARKKRKTINNIRSHMLFFGYDVSNMTDEEIEKGLVRISDVVSKTGITTSQAAESLRSLSCGFQNQNSGLNTDVN